MREESGVPLPVCRPDSHLMAVVCSMMTSALDQELFSMLDTREERAAVAVSFLARLLGFPPEPDRVAAFVSADIMRWAFLVADYHEQGMLQRATGTGSWGDPDAE